MKKQIAKGVPYQGADWIKRALKVEMSPLGEKVANLLGNVFGGVHNLKTSALARVDWANPHSIAFNLQWRTISTYDFNELTKLVVLCHDRALRMEISAANHHILGLVFYQRKREGGWSEGCPTMEGHIESIRTHYPWDGE